MEIIKVPIASVKLWDKNPRGIKTKDFERLKKQITKLGVYKPLVCYKEDGKYVVLGGNMRIRALKDMGLKEVDISIVKPKTEAEKIEFALSDNDRAGFYEEDKLAELVYPFIKDIDLSGFKVDLGEAIDLKGVVERFGPDLDEKADDVPEIDDSPAMTKTGDLFTLGKHRLLCGDSMKAEDVARLMHGKKAALCFTSPPYAQQRDYGKKITDWDGLMSGVFGNLPMADNGQVLVNLGLVHRDGEWWPYWDGWIEWMRKRGWRRFGWYVWDKGFGLCGDWSGRCAPAHEFIFHFNHIAVKPAHCIPKAARSIGGVGGKHTFRQADGTMRNATSPDAMNNTHKIPDSIWRSAPAHTAGTIEVAHPAVYPVALVSIAIEAWGGDLYDPFLGSGTTIIAAQKTGRICYGMEIDPKYCDVIIKRYADYTNTPEDSIHATVENA